jgi:tRNA (mo5U34)-methyltransferase
VRSRRQRFRDGFPLRGFDRHRHEIPFVDGLSDEDLAELNALLPWNCFTVDRHGRRFGNPAWEGKRTEPEPVPHPRIVRMHERLELSGKHVLEVGCLEGVHTVGLCRFAGRVTAIDSRIENVVKTIVRCSLYGVHPTVLQCDVEARPLDPSRLAADLAHHVGVLYHLRDPVRHLAELGRSIREGLLLDTHVARDDETTDAYEVDGRTYPYRRYREGGRHDAFSGMYDHAKWLRLEDILAVLDRAGFGRCEVLAQETQRHGGRVTLIARR